MSILSQFFGGARATSLPCGFGTAVAGLTMVQPHITTASGTISTPGTYRTILSHSGAGCLKFLALQSTNGTSKTMTLRITRDGVVLPACTTPVVATTNGFMLIGSAVVGALVSALDGEMVYDKSLLIEYTSSVAETDGANISYNYETRG